ncbi:MAG: undecaprenyl-phosphate glucose phosphotransferase [Gemmiger sp.]|uniref:undecaprenyl-phosphate glucose phosphotransferase n=1 Tax=Gemmiger sp. TaxID=2049027 RepID=UPI002E766B96|nr:undecaprenyl-phosphate glucose phosphotransferase [Gemmiger sp.]MEE0800837.1 undecaprenyl-phosphate glucose phosphotransferase [Gemmiger sp.]
MLGKNQRIKSLISSAIDVLLLLAAYLLANYLRFSWLPFLEEGGAGPALEIARSPAVALGWTGYAVALVILYWGCGLYDASRLRGLWRRSCTIALVNALGVVGFMALLFVFRLQNFSRTVMALLYLLATAFLIFRRILKRWYDRAQNRRGEGFRHLLVVGGGKMAGQYLLALEHNPYYSFRVDGYLAPCPNPAFKVRYLGGYDKMEIALQDPGLDEVVVALDAAEMNMIPKAFAACDKQGIRITMVPFYNDYLPARPTIDVLGDCKLINVRQTPFDNLLNAFVKRLMDVVGSLVLIVLTSPIMAAVAIGVKLSSPGPVIFRQERVGLNKRPFMMYKFRSMRVNADEESGWSTNHDPRKTRFGSLIRKFSLDELPQFFNVLKGDMSLVGPRPEVPYHVEHFKEEIPRYLVRQQVRPGVTGWAQINGLRGDTDIAERIRYDIWYIENWTVALDIKILFRTVFGGKMVNDESIE